VIPSSLDAFASFGVNSLDTRAKTTFSNSSRSHASIASTSLNALAYRTRDVARIGQSLDRVTRVQIVDRVVAHAPRDPSRRALETNASVVLDFGDYYYTPPTSTSTDGEIKIEEKIASSSSMARAVEGNYSPERLIGA
jgi:hypothetical protein